MKSNYNKKLNSKSYLVFVFAFNCINPPTEPPFFRTDLILKCGLHCLNYVKFPYVQLTLHRRL